MDAPPLDVESLRVPDDWYSPKTLPGYGTELQSAATFDAIMDRCGYFHIEREVCGELMQPRVPLQSKEDRKQSIRIDRLLHPGRKLLNAGWQLGVIGVELKASDVKLHHPVLQAADYGRCVFRSSYPSPGYWYMPTWVFVWPVGEVYSFISSIMMQNRVGQVCGSVNAGITFRQDKTVCFRWSDGVAPDIGKVLKSGDKVGSR